jgi:hypothetical protein
VCAVDPEAFGAVQSWIDERRRQWEHSLDRLTQHLIENPAMPRSTPVTGKEQK